MTNKQPFYHIAEMTFTGTTTLNLDVIRELLETAMRKTFKRDYVKNSLDLTELDEPEPGDPADLM